MFKKFLGSAIVASAMFLPMQGAFAGDTIIDEARFGGGWVDIRLDGHNRPEYGYDRASVNGELLFNNVNIDFFSLADENSGDFVSQIMNPRPHLGATIALEDDTTSSVYAGLTWHFPLVANLFLEGSFGGAIHDGEHSTTPIGGGQFRRGLGSSVLFRESVALGVEVTENINVLVQLSHMSHAGLAGDDNAGQTDVAIKAGWKF